jgi:hypothetical protein
MSVMPHSLAPVIRQPRFYYVGGCGQAAHPIEVQHREEGRYSRSQAVSRSSDSTQPEASYVSNAMILLSPLRWQCAPAPSRIFFIYQFVKDLLTARRLSAPNSPRSVGFVSPSFPLSRGNVILRSCNQDSLDPDSCKDSLDHDTVDNLLCTFLFSYRGFPLFVFFLEEWLPFWPP